MDNLLYYPYINIPDTDWTARALLYYNEIGCIVPTRYFYEPERYDSHMRELVRNELIIQIDPMNALKRPEKLVGPFINYLLSGEVDLEKRRRSFQKQFIVPLHPDKFRRDKSRIHNNKFDKEIFYQLEYEGLAIKTDSEWYNVEKRTALELMVYLATIVAERLDYLPTTDTIQRRFRLIQRKRNFEFYQTSNKKREIILNKLIPFPTHIDFKKLRKFKDLYENELNAFKKRVELMVLNPEMKIGSEYFAESVRELTAQKEELTARMQERKLGDVFFGTACGIMGAFMGLSAADTPGALLGGAPGFLNAIYSAVKVEKPESIYDTTGMKYLALMDKKLKR